MRDKMRMAARTAVREDPDRPNKTKQANLDSLGDFMEKLKDKRKGLDSRFRKGRSAKYEVAIDDSCGHKITIGTLFLSPTGALLLQFVKKLKRAHVMAALKCLCYSHDGTDPKELDKKILFTLANANNTASQCLVDLQVQPVDDVTDFVFDSYRVSYRQGTVGCEAVGTFCLCALGHARLDDPDTDKFDGGELTCAITAGGTKGDTFGLLTPEQQAAQYALVEGDADVVRDSVTALILKHRPVLVLEEALSSPASTDRRLLLDGEHIATVMYGRSKSYAGVGLFDVRIVFNRRPPLEDETAVSDPSSPAQPPQPAKDPRPALVPLWLASYCMNLLTFSNTDTEKQREGVRSVKVTILDPENPVAGKTTLHLQVLAPTIALPVGHDTTLAYPGTEAVIAPKIGVYVSEKGFLTKGFLEVLVNCPCEGDMLAVSAKSGVVLKDGAVVDGGKWVGRYEATAASFRLEFTAQSKATREGLQRLVRNFTFLFSAAEGALAAAPDTRSVSFTLCDKQALPNTCAVLMKRREDGSAPSSERKGRKGAPAPR